MVGAAAACLATPLTAQQPTKQQVDSLAREVRALRSKLDSALAALSRVQTGPVLAPAAEDTSLASLRASAAQAAGIDTTKAAAGPGAPDTTKFVGRERNQNQLNPEISVTGDVRGYARWPNSPGNNFDPREFEVGFQSALDPYSHTKIFMSLENDHLGLEEGYAYWTGLPGHIRFDIGKFRQQFGELNRWHLHAVPETEYPLVLTSYLGDDGLSGTGVSLYHAFGWWGTAEVTGQATLSASGDALFAGGNRLSYLGHLLNFWQLSRSTYFQLGGTGLYGTNPDTALKTTVWGGEFRFTWRPPEQALYREWTVRGELLSERHQFSGLGSWRTGFYIGTTYKLNQRFIAGARYDDVQDPTTGVVTQQIVPSLTLWQSEWVFLRGEYRWQKIASAAAANQVALQVVWAIGPHKHETY
jgi:hypothetical protein